jgi:hypothetical protein
LNPTSSDKPNKSFPFAEEIAELDKTLAAHHAEETQPRGAESRTCSAREDGGVYGIRWEDDDDEIPGEPPAHAIVWNMGPDKPPVEVLEARAVADVLGRKLAWARREVNELQNQLKGIERHSADAIEIKREVVAALKELVPLAKRNAKRGSPALLRMITRAVKTKL